MAAEPDEPAGPGEPGEAAFETPPSYEALLRELVAEREREQFLFCVDTILDGVQARIDRTTG